MQTPKLIVTGYRSQGRLLSPFGVITFHHFCGKEHLAQAEDDRGVAHLVSLTGQSSRGVHCKEGGAGVESEAVQSQLALPTTERLSGLPISVAVMSSILLSVHNNINYAVYCN